MSESSTAIGSLFDAQRTIIDQTFETQATINRQGLDLTRSAVKPVVGATVGSDGDAEAQVDDAFQRLEETQADLLEEAQYLAEQPVDGSERAAQWSADFFERQVERLQGAAETEAEMVEDVAESAEETAEDAADATQDAVEETAEAAEDAAESATDAADEVVEDLQDDLESAAEEFDAFEDVDATAAEGLAAEDIESVADLASASVETVADAATTTQNRAEAWIEAAVEHEDVALADLEGIGETYSERLTAAGVRTVDQLARTSAAEVAEIAEVDEDRAGEWIQQAQQEA